MHARFEVLTVMKIQVSIFLCCDTV